MLWLELVENYLELVVLEDVEGVKRTPFLFTNKKCVSVENEKLLEKESSVEVCPESKKNITKL